MAKSVVQYVVTITIDIPKEEINTLPKSKLSEQWALNTVELAIKKLGYQCWPVDCERLEDEEDL